MQSLARPVAELYLPASHGLHDAVTSAALSENRPAAQSMQSDVAVDPVVPAVWRVPAAQSMQLATDDEPPLATYLPSGQRTQPSAAVVQPIVRGGVPDGWHAPVGWHGRGRHGGAAAGARRRHGDQGEGRRRGRG